MDRIPPPKSSEPLHLASTAFPRAVPTQPNWQKYKNYDVIVDRKQNDKSKEIKLCSVARPHMRAFHISWWSFFVAFIAWFAIVPLLPDIQTDLQLTNDDIWLSSIAGFAGTILIRLVVGPLCDVYGPRKPYAILLCFAAIPTACVGFVNSAVGLIVIRLFIGVAGGKVIGIATDKQYRCAHLLSTSTMSLFIPTTGTFVMCQYWTSVMFSKEIVGTANGIVGGWGNLGASVSRYDSIASEDGAFIFEGADSCNSLFSSLYEGHESFGWNDPVPIVPDLLQ
jgi:MFS transporter, NNP family, nitrate/nitrite transporter